MFGKILKSAIGGVAAAAIVSGMALAGDLPTGGTVTAVENTKGAVRIAFLSFNNNPFWTPVTEGANTATAYLGDYNATLDFVDLGDELSAEVVVAGIEAALAQKYDGIVVVPIFDGTARIINEATEEGVPVFNIIAEGGVLSDRLAFIGQDAISAGKQIGAYIADQMDGAGKLGVITGYFGATQHTNRMNGALDMIKADFPDIEIIGPFENRDKAESAYSLVEDMYTAHPELEMVYVTAGGPFGAAKAVKDLGLTGKVGVVGFDHTPENVQYIKSGEMVGLLDQAPFQQAFDASVMLYNYIVAGQKPPSKVIAVEGNLMTPGSGN